MAKTLKLNIRPLQGFGAEVDGLDVSRSITPELATTLYAAWLDHGLLLFRGAVHSHDQHLALSRAFGPLSIHPARELRVEGEPYLIELGGSQPMLGFVYDGRLAVGGSGWHRDTSYRPDICKGAVLRLTEVPRTHGQTAFADLMRAYDDLTPQMKERIDSLEVRMSLYYSPTDASFGKWWRDVRPATATEMPGQRPSVTQKFPAVVHPLVVRHPESGRKALGISPMNMEFVLGIDRAESDMLLTELVDHATRPEYTYTHTWQPDDAIAWDNRRSMHAPFGYDPADERHGYRTTLAETWTTGRICEEAVSAAV